MLGVFSTRGLAFKCCCKNRFGNTPYCKMEEWWRERYRAMKDDLLYGNGFHWNGSGCEAWYVSPKILDKLD